MSKSGRVHLNGDLADEYGITDIDGKIEMVVYFYYIVSFFFRLLF